MKQNFKVFAISEPFTDNGQQVEDKRVWTQLKVFDAKRACYENHDVRDFYAGLFGEIPNYPNYVFDKAYIFADCMFNKITDQHTKQL